MTPRVEIPGLVFDNTFARDLVGLYVDQEPVPVPDPRLLRFNGPLAKSLGIDAGAVSEYLTAVFAGVSIPNGAHPIAQAYAGHQFGSYSPRLGDGRAVLLGELVVPDGGRVDIALKGSGPTQFSRSGDGRAGLGPVLREYLMGEAMHALGIPTTRALAAVTTGEPIRRQTVEPGAVLTRVGASHIRVGTFQYAAATGDRDLLARLVDYVMERHGPVPGGISAGTEATAAADVGDRAVELLRTVAARQARLIAHWMHVGFIHGVMNTDNMTVSGETIDYGPCAFMDRYDPGTVFSSIDRQGRYAYGNQPVIALWNLARLAEALLPLMIDDDSSPDERQSAFDTVTAVLDEFEPAYDDAWLDVARRKLGAPTADVALAHDFLAILAAAEADFTLAWRRLIDAAEGDERPLHDVVGNDALAPWLARWATVVDRSADSVAEMRAASPIYIPRNHLVDRAITAAVGGDLDPFDRLLNVVRSPFDERPDRAEYAAPAPPEFNDAFVTFCGT